MKKIKFLEQTTPTECGLCCLYMIMEYLGIREKFFILKQNFKVGRNGLSINDIKNIALHYGIVTKTYKIGSLLLHKKLPVMVFVENSHFIILESANKDRYKIVDPAIGTYILDKNEFFKLEPKYYTVFMFDDELGVSNEMTSYRVNVKKLLRFGKKQILYAIVLTVFFQIFSIILPFFIKNIIDGESFFYGVGNFQIIFLVTLIIILQSSIFFFRSVAINIVQNGIHTKLSDILVQKLVNLPMSDILRIDKSDILHRYNGTMIAKELFSERIISVWFDILVVIASAVYIATVSSLLFMVLILVLLIEVALFALNLSWKQEKLGKELFEQKKSLQCFFSLVDSLYILKSSEAHESMYRNWIEKFQKYICACYDRNKYFTLFMSIYNFFSLFLPIIVVVYCIYFMANRSSGNIMLLYLMTTNFVTPLNKILTSIDEILYESKYFSRAVEFTLLKEERNGEHQLSYDDKFNISLKRVSYQYEYKGEYVLKNINLDIQEGEFISVIGKSGCGKSTLAKLLMGYVEPTEGCILYNLVDSKKINKKDFRTMASLILQDNPILDGSIEYNIVLNRKDLKENDLVEVSKKVNIYDDIRKMPMGFKTQLTREHTTLSGGQKQRISLAREIICKPRLLVLDEPTSALDIVTEKVVQESLESLSCTRILITHRLNTIVKSDRIIIMDMGRIIDSGTHKDLYTRNCHYKETFDLYMNNNMEE